MKVRVVGSGSMWNRYNSASYLIDDNILVDFPNGMCKYLYKLNLNPQHINNMLITHFHGDHYFDIPFLFLLKARAKDKRINIFCSRDGKKKIKKIFKLAFPNSIKGVYKEINLKYNFNDNFKLDDYKVSKVVVNHGRMKPAYGYIISKDNVSVGFTGDSGLCDSVKNMVMDCNYVFCDCMFIKSTSKHMGIDSIQELIKINKNCIFVVSHMENDTRDELKKLNLKNVIVPEDGQIIDIK